MNRLTSDQKRQVLIDAGIDPTKYWLDDNDTVIDMPEQGTAETAVKSTLYNAPRTLAGFAGGALGLATGGTVGTLTGTPALGTVAGLGGMVAGGAAGSKVGESLMSALVPDDWRLAQEAREARSPMTVKVADVASSLALMRPSPTVLRAAARAPGEFLRTAGQMQPQTAEAALNVVGGAALGGGMALGQGAPMSDVLLETGLGALQHQPTALGTAMSGRLFRPFTDAGAIRPGAAPVSSALSAYADELARQQSAFAAKQRQQQELAAAQQAEFAAQQKKNAERVTNPAAVAIDLEAQRQAELVNRAAADRAAMLREVSTVQQPPKRGSLGEVLPDQPPLFQPKPVEDLRSVDERLAAAGEVPIEQTQAAPVPIERAPEAIGSQFEQSKKMLLSNELYDYFKDWADKFKVTMTRVPEIRRMVDGRLQEMSGEMAPRKEAGGRTDIIGSSTAYLDMQPHEVAHSIIHDTLNFGSEREKAFMSRLLNELGAEMGQDFTPTRDSDGLLRIQSGAEEALVNRLTPQMFDKLVDPTKVVSLKQAFQDFADYFMGRKLDAKTIERIAVDRMVFGSGAPKAVRKAQLRAFAGPRERLDESAALAEERLRSEVAVTEDARQRALEATDTENAARDAEAARATGEGAGAPEEPGAPAAPGTLELEAPSQTEQQTRVREMAKLLDERDRQERIAAIDARLKESINRLPISPKRRAQLEADRQALLREFEATRPSLAEEEGAGGLSQAERDIAAQQQFRDTGGEMPSGEPAVGEEYPSLTTPRRTFGVQRPPKRPLIEYPQPEDVTPSTAVSRPETIDYTGESVPANVRRGRAERESARETPEDLEMRRIEDRLSRRDRSRYQPKEESRPIVSEFEKQLNAERPFAMQPSKDGRIAANVIRAYVAKMPGVERELLEVGKLNDFLTKTPRPTPEELKTWADANLPKIEIKELAAVAAKDLKLSRIEQKIAAIAHELDTNYSDIQDYRFANLEAKNDELRNLFPDKYDAWKDKMAKLQELHDEATKLDSAPSEKRQNDSATRRYTEVNPRELADMPGAVDILVRMPRRELAEYSSFELYGDAPYRPELAGLSFITYYENGKIVERERPLYESHHYPESGANLLTHVRAYEHTLPDGTKALRVFELQSDWAQERRKLVADWPEIMSPDELPDGWHFKEDKGGNDVKLYDGRESIIYGRGATKKAAVEQYMRLRNDTLNKPSEAFAPNHPLLPQTQRLGLKAAIEYARQKGITKLIIDDAETAMLTEGHDRVGGMAETTSVGAIVADGSPGYWATLFGEDWRSGRYMRWADLYYRVDDPSKNFRRMDNEDKRIAEALAPYYGKDATYIPQERGMRLAYDNVLPQMMRKITGDQGQRVELGEHKNAMSEDGELRGDLIIKNPDKTPKTQSTGVMYDLSVPQARRATGEPFSMGGERYQPFEEDRPVFATQFQKELDSPNPLGAMPGKDGRIPANNLRTGLARLNNLERELLANAGLDKFLRDTPRPTVAELKLWANEKLPIIEIRPQMAVAEASKTAQARANLLHELESYEISPEFPDRVSDGMWFYRGELMPRWDLPEFAQKQTEALAMYDWDGAGNLVYDSATAIYTMVNPRDLADMPGAVDILVKMPDSGQKVAIDHYPKEGKDLVTHVRAYEHTLPDGTKALRVFELQSDWGQQRRKLETAWPVIESFDKLPEGWSIANTFPDFELRNADGKYRARSRTLDTLLTKYNVNRTREFTFVPDSPILSQTDALGLKAAIEYARERGISKLIIDDAETAMLTEGHDRNSMATATPGDYTVMLSNRINTLLDKITIPKSGLLFDAIGHRNDGSKFNVTDTLSDDIRVLIYDAIPHRISVPQERGMTRAYNDILPQLMRKMTGDKGVPVNMGKHKNAFDTFKFVPRETLIFKNPDGSPKTESTGIMYDLSVPQKRRATGEPFTMSNERYQPLGPDRATFKGRALPEREQPSRGIFAGNVEALRRSGDPVKVQFADTMDELYARIRAYTGRYESATMEKLIGENGILARMSGGREVTRKVIETMYDEDQQNRDLRSTLNAREQKVYDQLRAGLKQMRDEQIAAGQLIDGRPAKSDPYYFPNVVDSSVIHDLSYNPTSARAKEAEAQFIEFNSDLYQTKMGLSKAGADKKAREAFGKFIGSLKPMSIDSGFDFGAVSMPAGSKLPPTWIAADPIDGLRNYIKRFSRARAFYDVVARDEDAMRAIGRQYYYNAAGAEVPVTNPGTRIVRDPNVRALLENAIGVTHESREGFTPAIGRLANTLLLSNVMTRVTDAATTPFKALTYLPPQYLPGLLLNMRNMRSSVENAYKTGGVRRGDMMVVRDVLGAGDQMIQRMDRVSEIITKATGSEALEKGARFLAQNVGEYLYDINSMLAARGDKRATDFLNRLTPKWQTLAREEVAQRIAQLFQGKYDATNLPIWIQNSPAAPFFSMMKWNIEQWNNFKRFAWQPAMQGNVYPLVGTLLGGLVGGAAIGELREQISGKKQRVATLKELQYGFGEGDKARSSMEAMRKFAFLTQVTGTLGIVGELSLQAIDVASKDKPQGFSWPAFELASTVVSKLQNAASGIAERPQDAGLIAKTAADDLAKSVFTQYRLAGNAIDRATGGGEVAEANRRRDLRMSEKLRGEPTRFSPFIEREYKNERERMFDKERDRARAREMAGQLKATARAEAKTRDEYEAARRKLRASRIVGIPSRENNPAQYRAHINYVRMTQGSEAADRLAKDYQQLRTEQKWKSRLF